MLGEAWGLGPEGLFVAVVSHRPLFVSPQAETKQLLCFYFLLAVEITVNRTMWHLELDSPATFSALASPLSWDRTSPSCPDTMAF